MHSELMRTQPTHTTTVLSTLRTLQLLDRLDKGNQRQERFQGREWTSFIARFTRVFH